MLPQVCNLILVHGIVCGMNLRSRRAGERAARQEEFLLSTMVALAVTNLVLCLKSENSNDYAYAAFFIICCASYLKLRWWLSMVALLVPTLAACVRSPATSSMAAAVCGACRCASELVHHSTM